MQAVAAAGRPAVDHRDDDLGHRADQALHLEDVQPPALGLDPPLVDGVGRGALGVLVAGAAPDALVAAGAEGPLAVAAGALGPGAVAGEQHDADVGGAAGVVEHPVELVDGVRPERVEHLGPVERHAHAAQAHGSVVGDVGEVLEAGHLLPGVGVEGLADTGDRAHGRKASRAGGCGQLGGGVGGSCHARSRGRAGGPVGQGRVRVTTAKCCGSGPGGCSTAARRSCEPRRPVRSGRVARRLRVLRAGSRADCCREHGSGRLGDLTQVVLVGDQVVDVVRRPVAGSGYECAALELRDRGLLRAPCPTTTTGPAAARAAAGVAGPHRRRRARRSAHLGIDPLEPEELLPRRHPPRPCESGWRGIDERLERWAPVLLGDEGLSRPPDAC